MTLCKRPFIFLLDRSSSNTNNDLYLDVLGILTSYFPAKAFTNKNGSSTKRLPIVITDNKYEIYFLYIKFKATKKKSTQAYNFLFLHSQNELNCTLWGEYADQFEEFLATSTGQVTTIAFQLARLKTYEGIVIQSFTYQIVYYTSTISLIQLCRKNPTNQFLQRNKDVDQSTHSSCTRIVKQVKISTSELLFQ